MKLRIKLIIAGCVLAVIAGALYVTNKSVTPKKATWKDIQAEAKSGGYRTIVTDELWALSQSGASDLLFVDTRQGWEYRTGHIKGAKNFPMEPTWLARWQKKEALGLFLGPDKNRYIIFY